MVEVDLVGDLAHRSGAADIWIVPDQSPLGFDPAAAQQRFEAGGDVPLFAGGAETAAEFLGDRIKISNWVSR